MNNTTCLTCRFAERANLDGLHRCKRNAPAPTELSNPLTSHWPVVRSGDWCGEWSDKEGRSLHDVEREQSVYVPAS